VPKVSICGAMLPALPYGFVERFLIKHSDCIISHFLLGLISKSVQFYLCSAISLLSQTDTYTNSYNTVSSSENTSSYRISFDHNGDKIKTRVGGMKALYRQDEQHKDTSDTISKETQRAVSCPVRHAHTCLL
jgi:hypothetical protein